MDDILEICGTIITAAKKSAIFIQSAKSRNSNIADCTRICAMNTSKLIEQINLQNSSISSKDMQVIRKNLEITAKRAKESLLKMIELTKESLATPSSYERLSTTCIDSIQCVEEIVDIFWEIFKKEKPDPFSTATGRLTSDVTILGGFIQEENIDEELVSLATTNCQSSIQKINEIVENPRFEASLAAHFQSLQELCQVCTAKGKAASVEEKKRVQDFITKMKPFIHELYVQCNSPSFSDEIVSDINNNTSERTARNNIDPLDLNSPTVNSTYENNNNEIEDDSNNNSNNNSVISDEEIKNLVFVPTKISPPMISPSSPSNSEGNSKLRSTGDDQKSLSSFFVGRTPSAPQREGRPLNPPSLNKLGSQRLRHLNDSSDSPPTHVSSLSSPSLPINKLNIKQRQNSNDDEDEEDENRKKKNDENESFEMQKKAEKLIGFFTENFSEFGEIWSAKASPKKADLLSELATEISQLLKPKLSFQLNRSTTSRELQDIIRMRSLADLTKVSFELRDSSFASAMKQLAESTLNVIVGASTSVIQPSDNSINMEGLVKDLFLSWSVVLKAAPYMEFSESVKKVFTENISFIEEQMNSPTNLSALFAVDNHVVKAAKGQGAKLIEYKMKMAIWRDCESLRILTASLLSILSSCGVLGDVTAGMLFQLSSCARCAYSCITELLIHSTTTKHIMINRDHSQNTSTSNDDDDAIDINIWEEKKKKLKLVSNEKQGEKDVIKAASFNKLVQTLTSDKKLDNSFLITFITTYRSFTTPWQLFSKLLERYDVPLSEVDEKRAFAIKLRVAVVVKYWVDNQFYDFDDDLITMLFQFCETLQRDGQTVAKMLHDLLVSKSQERKMKQDSLINIPPTDLCFATRVMNPATLFMNYTDEEIARQITLVDFNIYKSIQVEELLQGAWSSDKLKHRSPNVCALLGRLNKLSFFVPSLILWQEKKRDRAFIISKFIRIADLLRKMNNYNSLMGIVAGLNVSSVTRLRHTLVEIDPKLTQLFQSLEKLMDPSLSFKNYRTALSLSKLPTLPYLGVYLTDLTFIEDGNPDNIPIRSAQNVETEVINFQKRDMVYNILQKILDYQQTPYHFPPLEPIHTLLTEFPHETERELYSLSILHEPRNADPKTII